MESIMNNGPTPKAYFWIFVLSTSLLYCTQNPESEEHHPIPSIESIDSFYVSSSIRALEVVDEQNVWFAGSGGYFGRTEDGGESWTVDTIMAGDLVPHFRSIAVTEQAAFLLSIGSPALLFRTTDKGGNWELVYREDHPSVFYDAMAFWNSTEGIAIGDPTDGCMSVIITRDGGKTWAKVSCSELPPTIEGEAAFAASNSNVSVKGEHAWIVSGGERSRVFHSPDRGKSWEVFETPIVEGGAMTGIFTVDFWDEKTGIAFGGDWEDKERFFQNKAITKNGGKTWSLVSDGKFPGFRSCVRYVPGGKGKEVLAVGIPGIAYSADGGENWQPVSDENFYTVRFGPSMKSTWVAGNWKVAKINWQ